jgi:hypothetical protein
VYGGLCFVLHAACFTFGEGGGSIHWIEDWEGHIARQDEVEKNLCPDWELNPIQFTSPGGNLVTVLSCLVFPQ